MVGKGDRKDRFALIAGNDHFPGSAASRGKSGNLCAYQFQPADDGLDAAVEV